MKQNAVPISAQLPAIPTNDYLAELGRVVCVWSGIEWILYDIFSTLSTAKSEAARRIFYSLPTLRAKSGLITTIAQSSLGEASQANLEDILKRMNKAAKVRNGRVHNPWGVADDGSYGQIEVTDFTGHGGRYHTINLKDLKQHSGHALGIQNELERVAVKIAHELKTSTHRHYGPLRSAPESQGPRKD